MTYEEKKEYLAKFKRIVQQELERTGEARSPVSHLVEELEKAWSALETLRPTLAACKCNASAVAGTLNERFFKYVVKTDTCWNWIGGKSGRGYGTLSIQNRPKLAHRVSYEMHKGVIPASLVVDHLCDNKACVNPDHLEATTHAINTLRGDGMAAKNRKKTHCKRGHEYTPENTYMQRKGSRECRTCAVDYRENARIRKRAREALEG